MIRRAFISLSMISRVAVPIILHTDQAFSTSQRAPDDRQLGDHRPRR